MGKHLNDEIKKIIVDLHKKGKKLNEISNIVQRPISTIHDIIMKSKVQLCNDNNEKRGRKEKLNQYEKRIISRFIIKDRNKSINETKRYIKESFKTNLIRSKVGKIINQLGFKSFIPRKKPKLTQ